MQNIKPQVVAALTGDATLTGLVGSNIFYHMPDKKASYPCVAYHEADNAEGAYGTDLESVTEILLTIDIWHTDSTSAIAQAVDDVMKGQGFYREFAQDLTEDDSAEIIYRKNMRYRKLRVFDGAAGTVYVDPWLNALTDWTRAKLPTWNIYAGMYPETYERPAVIFVPVGTPLVERATSSMSAIQRRFIGIVLSDLPYYHLQASETILAGLIESSKILLDEADRRYLKVESASSAMSPDSATSCRVSIELSRMSAHTLEDIPTIQTVGINGQEVTDT